MMVHIRRARSLLTVVVFFYCTISVAECQLDLQVHQTFQGINLLCSVGNLRSTGFSHLDSLVVFKLVTGKRQILASLSSNYGHNDPVSHLVDAQVTGQLSNENFEGYLKITWGHSGADLDGDYICDLNGEDEDFIPLTLTQQIYVQVRTMCPCFDVTPEVLRVGLTTELEAICYLPDPAAVNISRLASLQIIIIRDDTRQILAEINALTGTPVYEGPGADFVNGSLGGRNTFLRAVLEYPTAEMGSEYICEGSGVGIGGDPVFFSKHVNVSLEVPESEELIRRLFEMYDVQKELRRCQEEKDRLRHTSPGPFSQATTHMKPTTTSETTATPLTTTTLPQTTTTPLKIIFPQTTTELPPQTTTGLLPQKTSTLPQTTITLQTTANTPSQTTILPPQTTTGLPPQKTSTLSQKITTLPPQTTTTLQTTASPQTSLFPPTTSQPATISPTTSQPATISPTTAISMFPTSCEDANLPIGETVITVQPNDGLGSFMVLCEVTAPQEIWTVFQRRFDGSVSFYRNFSEYKDGFGNAYGELWLGLDNTRRLLLQNNDTNQLQVNLEEQATTTTYTKTYPQFSIGPGDRYILHVSGVDDDRGVGLSSCVGQGFSTYDYGYSSIANISNKAAGWWFPLSGGYVNINGMWGSTVQSSAMTWYEFRNSWAFPMGKTRMKFRRNN